MPTIRKFFRTKNAGWKAKFLQLFKKVTWQRRFIKRQKRTSSKNKKWSAGVTKHSNALDLERDVFKSGSAEKGNS